MNFFKKILKRVDKYETPDINNYQVEDVYKELIAEIIFFFEKDINSRYYKKSQYKFLPRIKNNLKDQIVIMIKSLEGFGYEIIEN